MANNGPFQLALLAAQIDPAGCQDPTKHRELLGLAKMLLNSAVEVDQDDPIQVPRRINPQKVAFFKEHDLTGSRIVDINTGIQIITNQWKGRRLSRALKKFKVLVPEETERNRFKGGFSGEQVFELWLQAKSRGIFRTRKI